MDNKLDQHRFSRMQLLVGRDGLSRLSEASVAVFGIGGVGGYAAEALARSGVGRLTLIDFDEICLTNVNRQIHALDGTIGKPKVQVMAERCRAINPHIAVEPLQAFYEAGASEDLLARGYDHVLDCIDHITAKLHLIQRCHELGLPIIASMGAANKLDPTQIKVADLFHTQKCRLARILRKNLRKRGISKGVKVVYSTEEYRPLSQETVVCAQNCICPNQQDQRWSCTDRRVILGSSSYIPPIFGLTMAGEVIRTLLGD
ncbi:tRNA A37 threonylcarbamoyladenosine dehydratase [Geoalkalibacter ferrihydriticus]|uniref:Thiamine biosynthesis protein ThiF n=2 Tax=Geoalkalibacter ferrihydriticus TaxID=392333 RepID=A0A0C2HYH6_9BACT|nr:tRNA threonylcarbamoyladenosine dehydratase [Geoalkalibacter ferrihydriticus]KIH77807.1 thiamine biosynthesis protein ThiF [Geoalkalibacter ferrihydriticus DSM 17813]SDL80269.1 tRNA A37 threonylcarbamoyladenosine dehydratase [Geoalkalibacter ferrihydriticus]